MQPRQMAESKNASPAKVGVLLVERSMTVLLDEREVCIVKRQSEQRF